MASGAAGDGGLFRGGFEGCISGNDMGISRRPYHRNCTCALHKSRGNCSHVSKCNVSYPVRRTWSEGCLSLLSPATPPLQPSPGTSPAGAAEITRRASMIFDPQVEQE